MLPEYEKLPDNLKNFIKEGSDDYGGTCVEFTQWKLCETVNNLIRKLLRILNKKEALYVACNFSEIEVAMIVRILSESTLFFRAKGERLQIAAPNGRSTEGFERFLLEEMLQSV